MDLEARLMEEMTAKPACHTIAGFGIQLREDKTKIYQALSAMIADGRVIKQAKDSGNFYYPAGVPQLDPDTAPKALHPSQMSEEEVDAAILAAIDAKKRSIGMIYRFTGWPRSFDLEEYVGLMAVRHKIRIIDKGVYIACFRYDQMPTRVWVEKDCIEAEFQEGFVPRDEAKKAMEMNGYNPDELFEEVGEEGEKKKRKSGAKRIEIDPGQLKTLAATEPNQNAIAEKFKISVALLSLRMKEDAELRKAYEEGKAANPLFLKANAPVAASVQKPEPKASEALINANEDLEITEPISNLDEDQVYSIALTNTGSFNDVAKALGYSAPEFSRILGANRELRRAYERGRADMNGKVVDGVPVAVPTPTPALTSKPKKGRPGRSLNITVEQAREVASKFRFAYQISDALGYANKGTSKVSTAYQRLLKTRPEIAAAIAEGQEIYRKNNQPQESALEAGFRVLHSGDTWSNDRVPEIKPVVHPTRIEMVIDEPSLPPATATQIQVIEPAAPIIPAPIEAKPVNQKIFDMTHGRLAVSFDGNFFAATPSERNVLMKLADLLDEIGEKV